MAFGRAERRGTPADLVVLGLGNPGADYAHTRHNLGADTIALLADRFGATLKAGRERAEVAEVRVGDRRLVLAVPTTYYNDAGLAAGALVRRHGLEDPEHLVVVYDEMDLSPGTIKVKVGGGLAGNNGLKSLKAHLGTDGFVRVRLGIGKPPGRQQGVDHVLRRPGKAERTELDIAVEQAADAVELILAEGPGPAMTRFNQRGDAGRA